MFGRRLRSARIARKITQQQISEMTNIALRTYQCYEQGTRYPSYELLVMYADILNVPIDWLLGRDDYLRSLGVSVDVSPEGPPKHPTR